MLIKQRKTHHWTTILTNGNAQFSIPYLLSVVNLGGMGLMARARTFRLERQVEAARFSGRRRTSGGSPVTATKWRAGGGAASLPVSTSSTLIKQFSYEKCREGGGGRCRLARTFSADAYDNALMPMRLRARRHRAWQHARVLGMARRALVRAPRAAPDALSPTLATHPTIAAATSAY